MTNAAKKSYEGRRGHLATITNQLDFDIFVRGWGLRDVWLGASDYANEGTFRWVDGPRVGQTMSLTNGFWNAGEPNNSGGDEDCAMISSHGYFNDVKCSLTLTYLVAYGPDPASS